MQLFEKEKYCNVFGFRVSVGLFCSTPAVAVGRAVPRKVAMEMLFTGHPITAQGIPMHIFLLCKEYEHIIRIALNTCL